MPAQVIKKFRARMKSNKEVDIEISKGNNRRYGVMLRGVESGLVEFMSPFKFKDIDSATQHAVDYADTVGE